MYPDGNTIHSSHQIERDRATTKIKEAPAQGKTIFEYADDSNAAADYRRVVEALLHGHAAGGALRDADGMDERSDEGEALTA